MFSRNLSHSYDVSRFFNIFVGKRHRNKNRARKREKDTRRSSETRMRRAEIKRARASHYRSRYVAASSHDASGDAALHVSHGCRRGRRSSSRICATGAAPHPPALAFAFPFSSHDESSGSAADDERDGKYAMIVTSTAIDQRVADNRSGSLYTARTSLTRRPTSSVELDNNPTKYPSNDGYACSLCARFYIRTGYFLSSYCVTEGYFIFPLMNVYYYLSIVSLSVKF